MIIISNGVNGSPVGDLRGIEVNRGKLCIINEISLHNSSYATHSTPVDCVGVWLFGAIPTCGGFVEMWGKWTRKAGDNTRGREYDE